MEVNLEHPIRTKLKRKATADKSGNNWKELIWLLFDKSGDRAPHPYDATPHYYPTSPFLWLGCNYGSRPAEGGGPKG